MERANTHKTKEDKHTPSAQPALAGKRFYSVFSVRVWDSLTGALTWKKVLLKDIREFCNENELETTPGALRIGGL